MVGDAAVILGAGMSYMDTRIWVQAAFVATAMAVAILAVLRPQRMPLLPVPPVPAILVVAGGILLVISAVIKHSDGVSFLIVTRLALLEPLIIVVIAWFALIAEPRSRPWLTATAVTYAIIGMIAVIPAYTEGGSAPVLLTCLIGNALVIAGAGLAAAGRRTLPA
jgi:hypothetical protein